MNKAKEQRMSPMGSSGSSSVRSPATRERRAVVETYEGTQLMPDEAMLPMPPHNMARSPSLLLQDTRQWLKRCQGLLRLLKRSG
ncbi:uncharacterized protein LOC6584336 [Drosophila mojavensis]|uniref:Uncharacterized protein n=1 Tax=Drosophila mojavensis TaxID=7230 RepID=B4L431_DROMO|nr:uncharacterized protein LOC6584336 [Drosophila mojavensis]EDW07309.2 uncharacterized protein Dmoj_GI14936 [Drosophila mojavensis]